MTLARTLTPHADTDVSLQVIQASHWEGYVGHFIPDHVRSGFNITDAGGLNANVASGTAYVIGCKAISDGTEVLALTGSSTNYVFIQVSRDGANEPASWAFVVNTTGTPPSNSMKIAEVVTGVSTISNINMKRIFKVDDYVTLYPRQTSDPTAPEDGLSSILYVKEVDSNNWVLTAYLKKNGAMQLVQIG